MERMDDMGINPQALEPGAEEIGELKTGELKTEELKTGGLKSERTEGRGAGTGGGAGGDGGMDEYVTIIASSLEAVMEQFRRRRLGARGFSIVGPAARQQFAFAGDCQSEDLQPEHLFGGRAMVGATFRRSGQVCHAGEKRVGMEQEMEAG